LNEELLDGEVVRLNGSKKCFTVEDAKAELPRLRAKDIHRTGSLVGPKTIETQGRPRELEEEIEAQLGLSPSHLAALAPHAPGARRDLIVTPEELTIEEPASGQLLLKFSLPAGSYATELVRAFSGAPWSAPRAAYHPDANSAKD
jgi:tRNA(Glu) U13 pseudouridine synthase TruD